MKLNNQIEFKISILWSILCDYGDAYILVNGIITIRVKGADQASRQANKRYKGVIFRNFLTIHWLQI